MRLFKTKEERLKIKLEMKKAGRFEECKELLAVKPHESLVFRSDHWEIDREYRACILSFFHNEGASDGFPAFWGIYKLPTGLADDVSVVLLDQVKKMSKKWLSDHQSKAERIANRSSMEQGTSGTKTKIIESSAKQISLDEVASELVNGASYLNVQSRIFVKAPKDVFDITVEDIVRQYTNLFPTISIAPYIGEQRRELRSILRKNDQKKGKGFYYTSTEYAGAYNLVTDGLSDKAGEFVGTMMGDVNSSCIFFDVDRYSHHILIASEALNKKLKRHTMSNVWGSKISQAAMLNNKRVVHLILDNTDLDYLGPAFSNITTYLDMNTGDINFLELFGSYDDELTVFPAHIKKIVLMLDQLYEASVDRRPKIRNALEDALTSFYINIGMWHENAQNYRDKLRIVNLAHHEYPLLSMFISQLKVKRNSAMSLDVKDDELISALGTLIGTFNTMLTNNGDLFDKITNDKIDETKHSIRTIYDFSKLAQRGKPIMTAQFINAVGFAMSHIGLGDTVIIHGAENISDSIKAYVTEKIDEVYARGGRVCFCYNKVDDMMQAQKFNRLEEADYTILGSMSSNALLRYEELMGQQIPDDLKSLISLKDPNMSYIRRGFSNVVFDTQLMLGLKGAKQYEP